VTDPVAAQALVVVAAQALVVVAAQALVVVAAQALVVVAAHAPLARSYSTRDIFLPSLVFVGRGALVRAKRYYWTCRRHCLQGGLAEGARHAHALCWVDQGAWQKRRPTRFSTRRPAQKAMMHT
jgi:hypothetical protein